MYIYSNAEAPMCDHKFTHQSIWPESASSCLKFHKERSITELNWEPVIFLRVTFSGLHREKLIAFFPHFLIEALEAKNKHPTFTDKRLDTRLS